MTGLASDEPDSGEVRSSEAPSNDNESPKTKWLNSSEGYSLLVALTFLGLIFFSEGIVHATGGGFLPHDTFRVKILRTAGAFALSTPFLGFASIGFHLNWANYKNRRRAALAELRSSTFPHRVNVASTALREATLLVEELRAELEARMALLQDVRRQVEDTEQRARDVERLSHVDESTSQALNRYFDEALARRLGDLERESRRRDYLLGTFGALAFGIAAILLSHYLFGF